MVVRSFTICLLTLFLALLAPARGAELAIVLSERGGVYAEFAEQLGKSLAGTSWRVTAIVTPNELTRNTDLRRAELWVSVGSEATRSVLAHGQAPALFATLLPRLSFEQLLSEQTANRPRGGITALVLDQPLNRQVHLIQQLFPGKKRLGVLVGPETRNLGSRLAQTAASYGLALEIEDAGDDAAVVPAVNRLLARADILFALPESTVYSRHNVRPLLLASYRFQRPLIGYSAAFVNAGAIAALYSTPAQLARQTAETLLSGRKAGTTILFPEKFVLTYNRQVAQSLAIDLPDEGVVLRALESRRQDP